MKENLGQSTGGVTRGLSGQSTGGVTRGLTGQSTGGVTRGLSGQSTGGVTRGLSGQSTKDKLTMRELPETERPYEKCLSLGPKHLSNAELLAVILKSGTGNESAVDLAIKLLSIYNGEHTLADIFDASIEELTEIRGIGRVKAISLKCVGELCERLSKESASRRIKLGSPDSIASYYMESMRHLKQEEVRAALFDTKNNLLRDIHISTGTVNSSLVTPREVFIKALKYKAVYIVLIHNHPSGDPTPSKDDLSLTTRLSKVGDLIQIPIIDHIIIGDNKYTSFKQQGLL